MQPEILTTLISLIGLLFSVFVSYFTGRRTANIEIQKMKTQIQQEFSRLLFEKRITAYPTLYSYLSDFIKILQFGKLSRSAVKRFYLLYQKWDSENAILFSARTGKISYDLRLRLSEIIKMSDKQLKLMAASPEALKDIRKEFQRLELALKSELGIYGFESPTTIKDVKGYDTYEEVMKTIEKY